MHIHGTTSAAIEAPLLATLLRDVPAFRALPTTSDDCLAAMQAGELRSHLAGSTLVDAGDVPPLLVVLSGIVGDDGSATSRGGIAALAAALARRPLPAPLRARTDATLYVLPVDAFERALLACPALTLDFARTLAARLDAARPALPPAHDGDSA